eukprot:TRINITY_DN31116_c0_g1_i1.p1 TRINITY_DN31116_c0_g1~~TRINITY_DN31116_c0_g1_i1.p1  ORF type:complete len:881 (-),score=174.10 TRINITY_DN31116_c0_g1_i1:115-2757(-)
MPLGSPTKSFHAARSRTQSIHASRSRASTAAGESERAISTAATHVFQRSERRVLTVTPGAWSAKLWWLLSGIFVAIILLLVVITNVIWYRIVATGTQVVRSNHKFTLNELRGTCKSSLESSARQEQLSNAKAALAFVHNQFEAAEGIVAQNYNYFLPGVNVMETQTVSKNLDVLWGEMRYAGDNVDFAYFADDQGTFAGYLRRSREDGTVKASAASLGMEYTPPDLTPSAVVCPRLCPPAAKPETLYFFRVNENGGATEPFRAPHPYDARKRFWYTAAVEQRGKTAWTGPYVFAGDRTVGFTASRAYFTAGKAAWVVAADIDNRLLGKQLKSLRTNDNETIFAMNLRGSVIASSEAVHANNATSQQEDLLLLWNETTDERLQTVVRHLLNDGELSIVALGSEGTGIVDGYVYAYTIRRHFKQSSALSFLIVSMTPTEVYTANMTASYRHQQEVTEKKFDQLWDRFGKDTVLTVLGSLIILLLGTTIMCCVARAITMPLRHISTDMISLAKMDFLRQADIESDPEPESDDSSSSISSGASELISRTSAKISNFCDCCSKYANLRIREIAQMRDAFTYMSGGLHSFSRYIDPNVMEILVKSKQEAHLGVAKADLTIFFSDLANFTTFAETLEPDVFLKMLGDYLEEMSRIIMDYEGTVGEFIGDAIMAWWNVPIDLGELHTVHAFRAALEQQRSLEELQLRWRESGMEVDQVSVRMGLVRGTVWAGNIGSERRMKFGLVGDSVNLASRLEGLCKVYGVPILVEQDARSSPGVEEEFFCRPLDLVIVKGRTGVTELFQLVETKQRCQGNPQLASHYSRFVSEFEAIQALYRSGSFAQALEALDRYQECWPEDVPAQLIRQRCQQLLETPPGPEWTPVEKYTHK